jgi:hydroxyethylthiazole kinase-like uncharacterized protein yjeF
MGLTCAQMLALEKRAFADGITAAELMEEAGAGMAAAVSQFFPKPGVCRVHFGKGHNGGDALVAARYLAASGWHLELRPAFEPEVWAPLTARQYLRLIQEAGPLHCSPPGPPPRSEAGRRVPLVVLDGLLGIGAGGELREPIRGAVQEVIHARREEGAHVFALDLPTGLDGDTGLAASVAVEADCTLTVGFPKQGLLEDRATLQVGRLAVIPLTELSRRGTGHPSEEIVATAPDLRRLWPRRPFDLHKGDCGRVGIVAGSRGLSGAAVLASAACLHAGAGLVTLYVPQEIEERVAAAAAPEVMVRAVADLREVLAEKLDVLAVGPGLGVRRIPEILALISQATQPMVVDADALNALASHPQLLNACAGPRLLTPHPGEMARLDPGSANRGRRATVEEFTRTFSHALLLKGARTLVGQQGRPRSYNSTGNPGMASGGMGDVLTGVCAALAGQGADLYDAARLGAWLCGRGAELAVFEGAHSEESVGAWSVLEKLGQAFKDLRGGCF